MLKEIDLEKLVKWVDNPDLHTFIAFDGDKPVETITRDLDSIKEALNIHDKIFLQIGFYGYDDEFEETAFMFDAKDSIEDLEDDYYDKYKFFVGGYGIYPDKNLNVEYNISSTIRSWGRLYYHT